MAMKRHEIYYSPRQRRGGLLALQIVTVLQDFSFNMPNYDTSTLDKR